jgi:hypothetical protein
MLKHHTLAAVSAAVITLFLAPAGHSAEQNQSQTEPQAPVTEVKSDDRVTRALLTTGIQDREPVDEIISLDKNHGRIYYFTEFVNMKGETVSHRWEYKDKVMAEVNINIASPRWRAYSSKNIKPEWTGIWTVSVVDENGKVLKENLFEVVE